jgi:hypothetical protein
MNSSRLRRRLALVRRLAASPRDSWLLLRMAGWALVVPVLKFLIPLPRLIRLVTPRPRRKAAEPDRVLRLTSLLYGSGAFHLSDNCLERSLVTFRYLAAAGATPTLVVGMRNQDGGYVGHAWVTVDGQLMHDAAELVSTLAPVVAFTADGRIVRSAEPKAPAA